MSGNDDSPAGKLSVDDWVALVQPHVDYCITCQPYDGGEAIWVLGDECYMEDLLGDFDVP